MCGEVASWSVAQGFTLVVAFFVVGPAGGGVGGRWREEELAVRYVLEVEEVAGGVVAVVGGGVGGQCEGQGDEGYAGNDGADFFHGW